MSSLGISLALTLCNIFKLNFTACGNRLVKLLADTLRLQRFAD